MDKNIVSEIVISSDIIKSFYSIYAEILNSAFSRVAFGNAFKSLESEFDVETLIPSPFLRAGLQQKSKYFHRLKGIDKKINDREITTIDDLIINIQAAFSLNKNDVSLVNLKKFYNIYHDYYDKTTQQRELALSVMQDCYASNQEMLNALSHFFNTRIKNEHLICILPEKTISGAACAHWSIQFFPLKRDREHNEYIAESCVSISASRTIIHEATHRLYHLAPIYKEILDDKCSHMNEFIEKCSKYFNQPKHIIRHSFDEALASCPAAYIEGINPNNPPKDKVWYCGNDSVAKTADTLAPFVYSVFATYIDDKKTLDNTFFKQLLQKIEPLFNQRQENLNLDNTSQSIKAAPLKPQREF